MAWEEQHMLKQTSILTLGWFVYVTSKPDYAPLVHRPDTVFGRYKQVLRSEKLVAFALQEIVQRSRLFPTDAAHAPPNAPLARFSRHRVLAFLGCSFQKFHDIHRMVFVQYCSRVAETLKLEDCPVLLPHGLTLVVRQAFSICGAPAGTSGGSSSPSSSCSSGVERVKKRIWAQDIANRAGLQFLLGHMVNDLGTYLPNCLDLLAALLPGTDSLDAQSDMVYDSLMLLMQETKVPSFTTLLPSVTDCVRSANQETAELQRPVYVEHFFLRQFGVSCAPVYDATCTGMRAGTQGRLLRKAVVEPQRTKLEASVCAHWQLGAGEGFCMLPLVFTTLDSFIDKYSSAVGRKHDPALPPSSTRDAFSADVQSLKTHLIEQNHICVPSNVALSLAAIRFVCKMVIAFPDRWQSSDLHLAVSAEGRKLTKEPTLTLPLFQRLFRLFLCCSAKPEFRSLVPLILQAMATFFQDVEAIAKSRTGGASSSTAASQLHSMYDPEPRPVLNDTASTFHQQRTTSSTMMEEDHHPQLQTTTNLQAQYGRRRRRGGGLAPARVSTTGRDHADHYETAVPDQQREELLVQPERKTNKARAFSLLLLLEQNQSQFFACLHQNLNAERAEGHYTILLATLKFFETMFDAVPPASWGANWNLQAAATLNVGGGGGTAIRTLDDLDQSRHTVVREAQFLLLEEILSFVLASVFAKHGSGWAYAGEKHDASSVKNDIGKVCIRIATVNFVSLFFCKDFFQDASNILSTRADADLVSELFNTLRKRQHRLLQLFAENAVLPRVLQTLVCEMMVLSCSGLSSVVTEKSSGGTSSATGALVVSTSGANARPNEGSSLLDESATKKLSRPVVFGFTNTALLQSTPPSAVSDYENTTRIIHRFLYAANWMPNVANGTRDQFRATEYENFFKTKSQSEDFLLTSLDFLLALLTICLRPSEDLVNKEAVRELEEYLLSQTNTPSCKRQYSVTCGADNIQCEVFSVDLIKSLFHLSSWNTGGGGISSTAGSTTSSIAVAILAAQTLQKMCLLWEQTDTFAASKHLLSEFLTFNCAPAYHAETAKEKTKLELQMLLKDITDANAAAAEPALPALPDGKEPTEVKAVEDAKPPQEGQASGLSASRGVYLSGGRPNKPSVHLGASIVQKWLQMMVRPDPKLVELRHALLSLACVGVRTQSSVFLTLEARPGQNLIRKCRQIVEECLRSFPVEKSGGGRNTTPDDLAAESTRPTVDKKQKEKLRWVANKVPLLWHAMHLLGEIVNTLFVDFESLEDVWLLLINVQGKVSQIIKECLPYYLDVTAMSSPPGRRGNNDEQYDHASRVLKVKYATQIRSQQYYFYLVQVVKEIHFLAYVGMAKVSQWMDTKKSTIAQLLDKSKSFKKLQLLVMAVLFDEHDLWSRDPDAANQAAAAAMNNTGGPSANTYIFSPRTRAADQRMEVEQDNYMQEANNVIMNAKDTTDSSMFVPPSAYTASRERLFQLCHKAGIQDDVYANLLSRDDITKQVTGTSYRNMLNKEVCEDLDDYMYGNYSGVSSALLLEHHVVGGTNAFASDFNDDPTSLMQQLPRQQQQRLFRKNDFGGQFRSGFGTDSLSHDYLAKNTAYGAISRGMRATRSLSDVSVVRSETVRRFIAAFDRLEREQLTRKRLLVGTGESAPISSTSATLRTKTSLTQTLNLLSYYYDVKTGGSATTGVQRLDPMGVDVTMTTSNNPTPFRTPERGGWNHNSTVSNNPYNDSNRFGGGSYSPAHRSCRAAVSAASSKQALLAEADTFGNLSAIVSLQHESLAMYSQLVLAVCELACALANAPKNDDPQMVHDLVSPLLPKLIPYISLLLHDHQILTDPKAGGSGVSTALLNRAATSTLHDCASEAVRKLFPAPLLPTLSMFLTMTTRILQFPMFSSPAFQFPPLAKYFNGAVRVPEEMISVLKMTSEECTQGKLFSRQLAQLLKVLVRQLQSQGVKDVRLHSDVRERSGGQQFAWSRTAAHLVQDRSMVLDAFASTLGCLFQLVTAFLPENAASERTTSVEQEAEIEEIFVLVLESCTELLQVHHQQTGMPLVSDRVLNESDDNLFDDRLRGGEQMSKLATPRGGGPARKKQRRGVDSAMLNSNGSQKERTTNYMTGAQQGRSTLTAAQSDEEHYVAQAAANKSPSSYQSWFANSSVTSASFGSLILAMVQRITGIVPVEKYYDLYVSLTTVLMQPTPNGMWQFTNSADHGSSRAKGPSAAKLLLAAKLNNVRKAVNGELGLGGSMSQQHLDGNTNSSSDGGVYFAELQLPASMSITAEDNVRRKIVLDREPALQRILARRIDACVGLYMSISSSLHGATLLLERGLLSQLAAHPVLQTFYGNGKAELSAYEADQRKPLHASWCQVLALVGHLLATAAPVDGVSEFLNAYEDRFLHVLEEKEMISELAMVEEVCAMSKILCHVPSHDARTVYLLSMALKAQNFLASVVHVEHHGSGSEVVRPQSIPERVAAGVNELYGFFPAVVPSLFHQRSQYLTYDMCRHVLLSLLRLMAQEPQLLAQNFFEVDYAGDKNDRLTNSARLPRALGSLQATGERVLADPILLQPGHHRGAVSRILYFGGLAGTAPYYADRTKYSQRVHWSAVFEHVVEGARRCSHFLAQTVLVPPSEGGPGQAETNLQIIQEQFQLAARNLDARADLQRMDAREFLPEQLDQDLNVLDDEFASDDDEEEEDFGELYPSISVRGQQRQDEVGGNKKLPQEGAQPDHGTIGAKNKQKAAVVPRLDREQLRNLSAAQRRMLQPGATARGGGRSAHAFNVADHIHEDLEEVCIPLALYLVPNPFDNSNFLPSARKALFSRFASQSPLLPSVVKKPTTAGNNTWTMCTMSLGSCGGQYPLGIVPEAVTFKEYRDLCTMCLELSATCVYQYCVTQGAYNDNVLYALLNLMHEIGEHVLEDGTRTLLEGLGDELRERSVLQKRI
ncbi:unnamed protein product [Amoebophrya sp. A120]|nr:unnamed protein product [Amoebophrya sp. A120]|eukprot:GSA120T00001573001.1